MDSYETRLNILLSGMTVLWFFLSVAISFRSPRVPETKNFIQKQRYAQLIFLIWLLVPYKYLFELTSFKSEVVQWFADTGVACGQESNLPNFNKTLWRKYSAQSFLSAVALLAVLYLACHVVFWSAQRSMTARCERRRLVNSKVTNEAEIGIKRKKKVAFQLPPPSCSESAVSQAKKVFNNVLLAITQWGPANKRQLTISVGTALAVALTLPKQLQHTFNMDILRILGFVLTLDHVFLAIGVFVFIQLVQIVKSDTYSDHNGGIRNAACKFVMAYGILIVFVCTLMFFQSTDTLMLYIYRVYSPCATLTKWRSFNDPSVPNVNIISAWLGENMMRYTNSVMENGATFERAADTVDDLIKFFICILGDCLSVVLFVNLVLVPGVLSCILG